MMLHKQGQRVLKTLHVICAGAWLGALAVMLLLLLIGGLGVRGGLGLDLAVYRLHDVVLFWAFVGTLVTGLLFSLFTPWGFVLHRWITVKWLLALALFGVTLFVQSPAVSGLVALADAGVAEMAGLRYQDFHARSLMMAILQLAIVVLVFAISTLKPWGKNKRDLRINRKILSGVILAAGALGALLAGANAVSLARYRNMPIDPRGADGIADGRYPGEARCGVDYRVEVTTRAQRVVAVEVVRTRDAHYARIAEAVCARIVAAQHPAVDAITGATTSSKCLMLATARALAAARAAR